MRSLRTEITAGCTASAKKMIKNHLCPFSLGHVYRSGYDVTLYRAQHSCSVRPPTTRNQTVVCDNSGMVTECNFKVARDFARCIMSPDHNPRHGSLTRLFRLTRFITPTLAACVQKLSCTEEKVAPDRWQNSAVSIM